MFLASATSFRAFGGCALIRRQAEILTTVPLVHQRRLKTSVKATQGNSTPTPLVDKPLPSVLILPPKPKLPPPPSVPLISSVPSVPLPSPPRINASTIQKVVEELYHKDKQISMNFSRLVSEVYQRLKTEGYVRKKDKPLTAESVMAATKQLIVTSNIPGIPKADHKVLCSTVPMTRKEATKAALISTKADLKHAASAKKPDSKTVEKSMPSQLASKEPMDRKSDNGRTTVLQTESGGEKLKGEKTSKGGTTESQKSKAADEKSKATDKKSKAADKKSKAADEKPKAADEKPKDAKIDKVGTKEAKLAEKPGATKMDKVDKLKVPIAKVKAPDIIDSHPSCEDYSLGPQSQELYASTVRMVLWQGCYDFLCRHQGVINDKVRARIVEKCQQTSRFALVNEQDWASFDLRAMLVIFSEFSDCFMIKKDGKNTSLIGCHEPSEPMRLFSKMRALINLDSHDNHSDPRGRYPDRQMDALIGTASNCLAMLGMDNKLLKSLSYEFKAIKILGKSPIEKAPFTFEPDSVRDAIFNEVHPSSTAASEAHETPFTKPATTEGLVTIEMTFSYIDSLIDLAEMVPATSSSKPESPNLTVQEWTELKMAMMRNGEVMRMATEIYGAAKKQANPKQKTWFVRNAKILLRVSEEMPTLVPEKHLSCESSGPSKIG